MLLFLQGGPLAATPGECHEFETGTGPRTRAPLPPRLPRLGCARSARRARRRAGEPLGEAAQGVRLGAAAHVRGRHAAATAGGGAERGRRGRLRAGHEARAGSSPARSGHGDLGIRRPLAGPHPPRDARAARARALPQRAGREHDRAQPRAPGAPGQRRPPGRLRPARDHAGVPLPEPAEPRARTGTTTTRTASRGRTSTGASPASTSSATPPRRRWACPPASSTCPWSCRTGSSTPRTR